LTINRWSVERLPCTVKIVMFIARVPPTSWMLLPEKLASVTPGTSTARLYWLLAAGSAATTSAETTLLRFVFWTSTTGASRSR